MANASLSGSLKANLGAFTMNYEVHPGILPADTLFIHGNIASNAWWRPALDVWRKEADPGFRGRAICAEWRGCGESSAPLAAGELEPAALADDYIALMRSLGIERAHVVGHSTGGLIALYAMKKAPQLFDRAVLLDPVTHRGVRFPPEGIAAFAQMARDRSVCEAVLTGAVHEVDPADPLFQELVDDAYGVAPLLWTAMPQILGEIADGKLADEARKTVEQVTHPVLVLHGSVDAILPIADSVALSEILPNAEFFEIKGHGHSPNVEDPELFVRLAEEHLFADL